MKRRFECMLILLLTCAFVSCTAFVSRASAENGRSPNQSGQRSIVRVALQLAGMGDFTDDHLSDAPTSMQELIDLVTNSDIAQKIQEVRDKRAEVRTERVNKVKDLFSRGIPASDD